MLGHMEEINQHRNNHDADANAHDPGKCTYRQAKQDRRKVTAGIIDGSSFVENYGRESFRKVQSGTGASGSRK